MLERDTISFTTKAVLILLAIVALIWWASTEKNRISVEREEYREMIKKERGINLREHDGLECVNGWYVITFTGHRVLYARDENFEPIKCEMPL